MLSFKIIPMETQEVSVKKIAMNYGFILALLSIVVSVIAYVTNNHIERPWWVSVLSTVSMVGVIVYGLKAYKDENSGFLSIAEALKVGLAISIIAGIIGAFYNYIFVTIIEPDFVTQMLDMTRNQMIEQNPEMAQDQMDMAMGITEKMMQPMIMSAIGIIMTLFFGFIISLISGLIMKVNRPEN